jgi:hypothetical protein
MSSAPLLQIFAVDQQSHELTGDPEITFFQQVYRRHVPFGMQTIPLLFPQRFALGTTVSVPVDRLGDLVTNMTLQVNLNSLKPDAGDSDYHLAWISNVGNAMIKQVDLEVGGSVISRQYGEWLHIWNELSQPAVKKNTYTSLVGGQSTAEAQELYVPLNFWFCRYTTLALPLISLVHQTVKVNITLRHLGELVHYAGTGGLAAWNDYNAVESATLLVDYVFLGPEQRQAVATEEHRFLIDQVQTTGTVSIPRTTTEYRFPLPFKHPVKAIYWVFQDSADAPAPKGPNRTTDSFFRYHTAESGGTSDEVPIATHMQLRVNGDDFTHRFGEKYFNMLQPYYRHTGGGSSTSGGPVPGLYMTSFCLRPETHQPTGTLNLSQCDEGYLCVDFHPRNNTNLTGNIDFRCYGLSYNIFVISGGMGALRYSTGYTP